jgi:phage replication initiation protein
LWETRNFGAGGNQPKVKQVGNWRTPDGSGRTIYIGQRKNGKCLRVYEKGMQLGAEWHPWVRWELSYGSRSRILPWEVLTQPGQYVVGAYPKALAWITDEASRIRTIQKQLQLGYDALTQHASRAFGPFISVMLKVEGSAEKVVEKLQREGVPKRLTHPFTEKPDEWLE